MAFSKKRNLFEYCNVVSLSDAEPVDAGGRNDEHDKEEEAPDGQSTEIVTKVEGLAKINSHFLTINRFKLWLGG